MLAHSIPFVPSADTAAFAQIPAAPGVFLLRGSSSGDEPYISKTANLKRRVLRLLAPPDTQSKRLNLRERCSAIEFTVTGSDFESGFLFCRALRDLFPKNYAQRLHLHPAALVRLHWENAFPRAYVTRKLGRIHFPTSAGKSVYFGPFRSRAAADEYLNGVLDLYKSRRCTFELHPDPAFPGCVYSEMKMCLAPCFKGCSDEEYLAEIRSVEAFLDSRGESYLRVLTEQREHASAALEFESAAALQARIEKVKSVVKGADEITGRLDRLDAVIVQPSAEAKEVSLFRFVRGQMLGPTCLSMPAAAEGDAAESGGVVAVLKAALEGLEPEGAVSANLFSENLSLLKRWYFRSHRAGEIVFRNPNGKWPWTKLSNSIGRMVANEGPK